MQIDGRPYRYYVLSSDQLMPNGSRYRVAKMTDEQLLGFELKWEGYPHASQAEAEAAIRLLEENSN